MELESAEFIDDPLIAVSWTSTVVLGVVSRTLFGNYGQKRLNGLWMNLALLLVVAAAFLNLSYRVNRPVLDLPYYCYLRVWDGSYRRACVLLFFMVQLMSSLAFCVIQTLDSAKASTGQRKFFHLTISLIALSGILYEPEFTRLAAHLMLQIFVILELLRTSRSDPWSEYLNRALPLFIDPAQESEHLILTPILLIAGVFLPLFLSPINHLTGNGVHLRHFVGIATVGVGDSFAAIVGSRFGKTKLMAPFRSHKSFEGTLAMLLSQAVFYSALLYFEVVGWTTWDLVRLVLAICICTLVEAASKIGDNLILPFIGWLIL